MTVFKQKDFSKIKSIGKYIKNHPILPLSAASLGVGLANYTTNTKRRKEGLEQHKEQVRVLKELSSNITKNSEALREVNSALKKNNLKTDPRGEIYLNQRGIQRIKKIRFPLFKEKDYSIQEGGFKGQKISPKKGSIGVGAGIGAGVGSGFGLLSTSSNPVANNSSVIAISALIGAGVGAVAVWLSNIARESIFNTGLATKANSYTLIKSLESIYLPKEGTIEDSVTTTTTENNITHTRTVKSTTPKSNISPVGTLFSVDNDPKKHVVNILLRGNVMSILVNKPSTVELQKINGILDNYCRHYKLADYTATKLESNIYLVEVNIVDNTEATLVNKFIESGLKVNVLTTDRFGIKNM